MSRQPELFKKPPKPNKLNDWVVGVCRRDGIPIPETEVRFVDDRMWRLDFAWPEHMVGLEVDGGVFLSGGKGGHNRGAQIMRDYEKRNVCALAGWKLLQMTTEQVNWGKGDYFSRVIRIALGLADQTALTDLMKIQTKPVPKKSKSAAQLKKLMNGTKPAPF